MSKDQSLRDEDVLSERRGEESITVPPLAVCRNDLQHPVVVWCPASHKTACGGQEIGGVSSSVKPPLKRVFAANYLHNSYIIRFRAAVKFRIAPSAVEGVTRDRRAPLMSKSFLLLFYKKEVLPLIILEEERIGKRFFFGKKKQKTFDFY